MPTYIPTPASSTISKGISGLSDASVDNDGVIKMFGCTVMSVNMSVGFNGSPSSCSLTLVEDIERGDGFTYPVVPSIAAVSLPRGGVGQPVVHVGGYNLNPSDNNFSNVPFYFCGVVQSYKRKTKNSTGKTIDVTLSDCMEVFNGLHCLLGGFSLSHSFDGSRYTNVKNIIDVFGYYNHGLEANLTESGMLWSQIKPAIESVKATLFGMNFEFMFSGTAFNNVPDWYRISGDTVNIISICNQVAEDGGADVTCIGRKHNADSALVEFKAISRKNENNLSISSFTNPREDIIISKNIGREFKNESTNKIVSGGFRNKNYVAWPTDFNQSFREGNTPQEQFANFPVKSSDRLLDSSVVNTGSVFPFWGYGPDGNTPLMDPMVSLDQFSFRNEETKSRIPLITLVKEDRLVREVNHKRMFLEGDEDSDTRPFYNIYKVRRGDLSILDNEVRGIPLNDEIMKASLVNANTFYNIFRYYYNDLADDLFFPDFDFSYLDELLKDVTDAEKKLKLLKDFFPQYVKPETKTGDGRYETEIRYRIYNWVRDYTLDYMGRSYLVCLPKSRIMQRIFNNQSVPTRKERPEIEYNLDQVGYWEVLPSEFDGLSVASDPSGTYFREQQIREKFMNEEGRFNAMAVMNWKPKGNSSFFSNGSNQVMFQDLPTDSFRPNNIAETVPDRVFIECGLSQPTKRPDLAVVNIPNSVRFDHKDTFFDLKEYYPPEENDLPESLSVNDWLYRNGFWVRELWRSIHQNSNFEQYFFGIDPSGVSEVVNSWASKNSTMYEIDPDTNNEVLINTDIEAFILPLTSRWVTYGPWYDESNIVDGMVDVESDRSLVPWNFPRPSGQNWDYNLNAAGEESVAMARSTLTNIDDASIVVAGWPEISPTEVFGYNSNLTGISVDFSANGVKTSYNFSTYDRRPGTYRKWDFDKLRRAYDKTKDQVSTVRNINFMPLTNQTYINRFRRNE